MKCICTVFNEALAYIKRNKLKTVFVILAMILAYGFYVSSYTLNIDDNFTDFWNGGRLIAAGRFTGVLVQSLTGIMTYSPFFTMFLALIIFFFAGLVLSMVLYLVSQKKLSDNALFVFWLVFITYPIMSEQIVYPIIVLLALGYLLTALSIYLVDTFIRSKNKKGQWGLLITALIMMILYIDFYEAFASVYLTAMMGIILIRFMYSSELGDKKISKIIVYMLKLVAILLVAIIIRMVISKIVIFLVYGTTQFGYSGNNSVSWFEIGIFDCAFWFVRTVFYKYFWAAVDYFAIFVFVASVICGTVITLVYSIKKKSYVPIIAFLIMIMASLSLNFIIGIATKYTMAQALAIIVAFTSMLLYVVCENKKSGRIIASVVLCLLVLNQAKSLNTWSVLNYERHSYEVNVVDNIGMDLTKNYPIDEKPVVFISGKNAPHLTEYQRNHRETSNPIILFVQKKFLDLSNAVIPEGYFNKIGDFYNFECNNAEDLLEHLKTTRNSSSSAITYLSWTTGGEDWFNSYNDEAGYCSQTYNFFELRGFELIRCSKEDYNSVCEDYNKYPAYPKSGYITETDKYIIVNFGE